MPIKTINHTEVTFQRNIFLHILWKVPLYENDISLKAVLVMQGIFPDFQKRRYVPMVILCSDPIFFTFLIHSKPGGTPEIQNGLSKHHRKSLTIQSYCPSLWYQCSYLHLLILLLKIATLVRFRIFFRSIQLNLVTYTKRL